MINSEWSLRELLGDELFTKIIAVIGYGVALFGFLTVLLLLDRKNINQFKQEAIERGFASYKVDSKGVVTFEWNK